MLTAFAVMLAAWSPAGSLHAQPWTAAAEDGIAAPAVRARVAPSLPPVSVLLRRQTPAPPLAAAELPDDHHPRGALWRAAVLPGWGQIYNRQYLKLPFVYGGILGFAGAALYANSRYLLYRRAYLYAVWPHEDGVPRFPQYEDDYLQLIAEQGLPLDQAEELRGRLAPELRQFRDNLRRNRDLLYFGIGLYYGLTVLDAYVSAHLLDFDVGEELALGLKPGAGGIEGSIRWRP